MNRTSAGLILLLTASLLFNAVLLLRPDRPRAQRSDSGPSTAKAYAQAGVANPREPADAFPVDPSPVPPASTSELQQENEQLRQELERVQNEVRSSDSKKSLSRYWTEHNLESPKTYTDTSPEIALYEYLTDVRGEYKAMHLQPSSDSKFKEHKLLVLQRTADFLGLDPGTKDAFVNKFMSDVDPAVGEAVRLFNLEYDSENPSSFKPADTSCKHRTHFAFLYLRPFLDAGNPRHMEFLSHIDYWYGIAFQGSRISSVEEDDR